MSVVGLARGVILQALRDALDLSLGREREDALRFFEDGRLEFWAEVGELSAEKVDVPQEISSAALTLDKLYVPTRYPNAWAEGAPHEFYSREDAVEALECSRKIIDWVEELWKCLKRERS